MALIDAVANSIDVPLWRLFGGVSNSLTTAVTVMYLHSLRKLMHLLFNQMAGLLLCIFFCLIGLKVELLISLISSTGSNCFPN